MMNYFHVLKFIFVKTYFIPEMSQYPKELCLWEIDEEKEGVEEVMVELLVVTVEKEEEGEGVMVEEEEVLVVAMEEEKREEKGDEEEVPVAAEMVNQEPANLEPQVAVNKSFLKERP